MSGRKPDYRVGALNKATGESGTIGAAWKNDGGAISITVNAFTVLPQTRDLVITLFPENYKSKKTIASVAPDLSDEEIPR